MRRQRGSLLLYGSLAAGAAILALGVALKVQNARLDAAQQENKALAQQVSQWTAAAKECSEATERAKVEADNRAANAAAALQRARAASAVSRAEVDRLRSLAGSKPAGACPAGHAAVRVREGLKP